MWEDQGQGGPWVNIREWAQSWRSLYMLHLPGHILLAPGS